MDEVEQATLLYDVLIPIQLPAKVGFYGRSGRGPYAFNGEIAFRFGAHEASLHTSKERHYIIIRLAQPHAAALAAVPEIRDRIALASVELDLSIRPLCAPIRTIVRGERADLDAVNILVAGDMPSVVYDDNAYAISTDVSVLGQAVSESRLSAEIETAARIFADIDFETSNESRFVLLSTVLELLAVREQRDADGLAMLAAWSTEATARGRADLAGALKNLQTESISAAIGRLAADAAHRAGCSPGDVENWSSNARKAYGKRSALLHQGKAITVKDLTNLRAVVRLILTGRLSATVFTQIGIRQWEK